LKPKAAQRRGKEQRGKGKGEKAMTKTLVLAGAAVLLMSISILGQPDRPHNAGRTQLQSTQDEDFKIKVKDDRVIVRDKSKPVRRALE
jgi:hypothetical protein